MKKHLLIAFFNFSVVFASSQERYFQIWNQNNLEIEINDRMAMVVNEKMHYQPKTDDVRLKLADIYLKRQFTNWFEAGASGRLLWIKDENNWMQEYRPMVFGNLTTELNILNFEFSNRLEYRIFRKKDDYFRHRHMLLLEIPPFPAANWFKLYWAEEGFFRFDEQELHLFRFYTGTKIRYHRSFEMKIYYVLEKSKKNFSWTTSDVLGLNLSMDF